MFIFQLNAPDPASVQNELQLLSITTDRRLQLLSTAMFIAMAFGFLGFGLFLIQAKGDVEAEGGFKDYKFKFANLSPGLFVILCSTVIIIFSATFKIGYDFTKSSKESQQANKDATSTTEGQGGMPPDAPNDKLKIDSTKQKR